MVQNPVYGLAGVVVAVIVVMVIGSQIPVELVGKNSLTTSERWLVFFLGSFYWESG